MAIILNIIMVSVQEDSSSTEIIEKAEVSPNQFPKVMWFLKQIYDTVFSVKDTVVCMYKVSECSFTDFVPTLCNCVPVMCAKFE